MKRHHLSVLLGGLLFVTALGCTKQGNPQADAAKAEAARVAKREPIPPAEKGSQPAPGQPTARGGTVTSPKGIKRRFEWLSGLKVDDTLGKVEFNFSDKEQRDLAIAGIPLGKDGKPTAKVGVMAIPVNKVASIKFTAPAKEESYQRYLEVSTTDGRQEKFECRWGKFAINWADSVTTAIFDVHDLEAGVTTLVFDEKKKQ